MLKAVRAVRGVGSVPRAALNRGLRRGAGDPWQLQDALPAGPQMRLAERQRAAAAGGGGARRSAGGRRQEECWRQAAGGVLAAGGRGSWSAGGRRQGELPVLARSSRWSMYYFISCPSRLS